MPTEPETARLAAAIHLLRPDWPAASIAAVIRAGQPNRPLHDLAVALAWIATDPQSRTPARVNESGPWWSATAATTTAEAYYGPMLTICRTCGFHHRPDEDHYRRQPAREIPF